MEVTTFSWQAIYVRRSIADVPTIDGSIPNPNPVSYELYVVLVRPTVTPHIGVHHTQWLM